MAIRKDSNGTLAVYNEWSADITHQDYRDRVVSLLLLLGAAKEKEIDQSDIKNVCSVVIDMLPSEDTCKLLDLTKEENVYDTY